MLKFRLGECAAILIDGQNTNHTMRMVGWQLDYDRVRQYFTQHAALIDICYFTALKKSGSDPVHKLTHYLKNNGYVVVTRSLARLQHGDVMHGNMVQEITEYATSLAMFAEHIILFSGSGEFGTLAQRLQAMGCRITIISTPAATAASLRRIADDVVDIADLRMEFERVSAALAS